MSFSVSYWDKFYRQEKVGWDIGYVSTPLKEYFDQLTNTDMRILIPGAGRAWEAEYLFNLGFDNTFVLDFSPCAIDDFKTRCPEFPDDNIIRDDYFDHEGKYDLIVEQTFFCSFQPDSRNNFVASTLAKLSPKGKYMGLLFNHEFPYEGPPFGGSEKEYLELFKPSFDILKFEIAHNSIKPRKGREIFFLMQKK